MEDLEVAQEQTFTQVCRRPSFLGQAGTQRKLGTPSLDTVLLTSMPCYVYVER